MQNHLEINSKSKCWTGNVRNLVKSWTSVMSGLAKASPGGQVLVSKAGFPLFLEMTPFQFDEKKKLAGCLLVNRAESGLGESGNRAPRLILAIGRKLNRAPS